MKSCKTCKIYYICVFNDNLLEGLVDEDRYLDDRVQAVEEIERVIAAHCLYYTPAEDMANNQSWVPK